MQQTARRIQETSQGPRVYITTSNLDISPEALAPYMSRLKFLRSRTRWLAGSTSRPRAALAGSAHSEGDSKFKQPMSCAVHVFPLCISKLLKPYVQRWHHQCRHPEDIHPGGSPPTAHPTHPAFDVLGLIKKPGLWNNGQGSLTSLTLGACFFTTLYKFTAPWSLVEEPGPLIETQMPP